MNGLIGLILAACVGAGVAVFWAVQRRHRAQVEALLARLEELEAARPSGHTPLPAAPDGIGSAEVDPAAAVQPTGTVPPTGDVLAGRTTTVERMLEGGEGIDVLADQAIVCIHGHLEENIAPGQVAEQLFVSLRTLERGLAASLDCTPSQLILAMKMREARKLLKSGKYRVNEVAYRLAFSSPSHFSRRFKSFYREPPSELVKKA